MTLSPDDRAWLRGRLAGLEERYTSGLPPRLPPGVIHGNPSVDNVVTTTTGDAVLLDLDRVAVGPPEWDPTTIAVGVTTFGTLSAEDYRIFCDAYGYDVMTWQASSCSATSATSATPAG